MKHTHCRDVLSHASTDEGIVASERRDHRLKTTSLVDVARGKILLAERRLTNSSQLILRVGLCVGHRLDVQNEPPRMRRIQTEHAP